MIHNRHLPGSYFTERLMSDTIQQTEKLKIEKYNTANTPGTLDFSMQIQ
jgi:hypothetical protein